MTIKFVYPKYKYKNKSSILRLSNMDGKQNVEIYDNNKWVFLALASKPDLSKLVKIYFDKNYPESDGFNLL